MTLKNVYIFETVSRNGQLLSVSPAEYYDFSKLDDAFDGDFYGNHLNPYLEKATGIKVTHVTPDPNVEFWRTVYEICNNRKFQPFQDLIITSKKDPRFWEMDHTTISNSAAQNGVYLANANHVHQLLVNSNYFSEVVKDSNLVTVPDTRDYVCPNPKPLIRHSIITNACETMNDGYVVVKVPESSGIYSASTLYNDLKKIFEKAAQKAFFPLQVQTYIPGTKNEVGSNLMGTSHIIWTVLAYDRQAVPEFIIKPHAGVHDYIYDYMPDHKSRFIPNLWRALKQSAAKPYVVPMKPETFKKEADALSGDVHRLFSWLEPFDLTTLRDHFMKETGNSFRDAARTFIAQGMTLLNADDHRLTKPPAAPPAIYDLHRA